MFLAEVELEAVDAEVALPDWVGPEVSRDDRFFNVYLYENPFEGWGVDYADLVRQAAES